MEAGKYRAKGNGSINYFLLWTIRKQEIMNEFEQSYQLVEKKGTEEFLEKIYRKRFPDLLYTSKNHWNNSESQQAGIDRILIFPNKKTILVEEKVRDKDYSDIWLEYISNDKTGKLGWIEQNLNIDYLVYAFLPSQTAYFFDWKLLKRAWEENKKTWTEHYKTPPARNKNYNSYGCPVPIEVLMKSMNRQMKVKIV